MTFKSAFRVSVCGGGIGGLTLALVIGKYSTHPVEIFEAGPTIATFGAGVSFFDRSMEVFKALGIYDEIVKTAISPPQENTGPTFRKSDQVDGYYLFTKELKRGPLLIHRKDLVDCLLRHLPPSCKVHISKKLRFYENDGKTSRIALYFSDGSSAVTDVLVGADGIHSATRTTMYRKLASLAQDDDSRKKLLECIDPVFTGVVVYRYMFPKEKLLRECPGVESPTNLTLHIGKKKHIVTFPISQGNIINVVIFVHDSHAFGTPFEGRWMTNVPDEEVLDLFEGWEPRARALAKCVEKPSKWALHSVRPLPHYVNGRVVLLGDAAHAMEPHFGAGAGQAIEDAYVLGRLLTHKLTNRANVHDALKVYEDIRLPFANGVVQQSQDVGRYYGFQRISMDDGPVEEELERVCKSIDDAWEWQSKSAWVWAEAENRWETDCRMCARL